MRIGMYDSGVGGLTVLAAFVRHMPEHDYVYFGDTLHAPYGDRTAEEVRALSLAAVKQLVARDIDLLVVACNTSASVAVDTLVDHYPDLPVLTLLDAVGPAVQHFPGRKIALLATRRTVEAGVFEARLRSARPDAAVRSVAAPALVPLIERGVKDPAVYGPFLDSYLKPLATWGAEVLVLGCTHYPLIANQIQSRVPHTLLIDPANHLARHVAEKQDAFPASSSSGSVTLLASGDATVLDAFWKSVSSQIQTEASEEYGHIGLRRKPTTSGAKAVTHGSATPGMHP
ncbi:glutamate racemase [Kyrpidia spormannii]|uniref:glutamate racemase n=1 Tax=Kyrpidia spormannii TaxID=2055160 RepID=UPI0012FFE66B|nr:glutamate racemase [Kyrpidia spormannii]